jgi:hypothetical protein
LERALDVVGPIARGRSGPTGVALRQIADWLLELRNMRTLGEGRVREWDVLDPDGFAAMWSEQVSFMELLVAHRGFPRFPVALETREGQRLVKEIANDAMGELHEAIQHLKNVKRHRATDVPELDRGAFLEELVDAFKFMLEVAILAGVSRTEFITAFRRKSAINRRRITIEGY